MKDKMVQVALCYDFDGTLSPKAMQEYGFMRATGQEANKFWTTSNTMAKDQKADNISAYMRLMLQECARKKIIPSRQTFHRFAKGIELFQGVVSWFGRINRYGLKKGILIKHYIISSGLKEILEGTDIAKNFTQIFASSFMYDESGVAVWPAIVLNYTSKTQFIFRINKGCEDISDNVSINNFVKKSDRPIPFEHMIYFGDGETDIPCMKMIKVNGGHSVAVFKPHQKDTAQKLIHDDRVNIAVPADYRKNSMAEKYVCAVIDKIAADINLQKMEK